MARMWTGRSLGAFMGIVLVGLGMTGCAKNRDDLVTTNRSLQDQNIRLQNELRDAQMMLRERDGASEQARQLMAQYQREIAGLETELDRRDRALRDFGATIDRMDVAALDPATDRALAALAAQHPNLLTYDADKGMLRFSSDLTFDSGSAEVKPEARTTLQRLAQILSQDAASGYVIDIVGHTDSQQPSAATRQRHPTNLHLSCHRAIAVHQTLASMGINRERMRASGWGEHRPLVNNTPTGNTPQNRRVEIFLTRSRWSGPGTVTAGAVERGVEIDRAAPPPRPIDSTK